MCLATRPVRLLSAISAGLPFPPSPLPFPQAQFGLVKSDSDANSVLKVQDSRVHPGLTLGLSTAGHLSSQLLVV